MNNQARQWPLNLTAGLQPVQLVHNYQLGHLVLLFSIKHELHDGLVEPLMSSTVWKNSMGRVKQVAYNKHVWLISGLASVAIDYDKEQKEIRVVVTFREDAEQMSTTNRLIAEIFGEELPNKAVVIKFPSLKYTFCEEKAARRCG